MNEFVRTNDDGENVLDYDLLDLSSRINFQRAVENWATEVQISFDIDDPDFSEAEILEGFYAEANEAVNRLYVTDAEGNVVDKDGETKIWMVEIVERSLRDRYMSNDESVSQQEVLITEEHLGGDATRENTDRMIDLLRERGWNVRYGASKPGPQFTTDLGDVDHDAQSDFDSDWNECLSLL